MSSTKVQLVNNTSFAMFLGENSYATGSAPAPYCSGESCTSVLYNGDAQEVNIASNTSWLNLTYTLCIPTDMQPGPWCSGPSPGYASIQFQPGNPMVYIAKANPSSSFTLTQSGNTYTLTFKSAVKTKKKKKFT